MEQLEEFADAGAPKYRVKGSGARLPRDKPAVAPANVPRQMLLYVRCMQYMLELQTEVVTGWFGVKAYVGVVKQMWRALVIESQILDEDYMAKCAPSHCAFSLPAMLCLLWRSRGAEPRLCVRVRHPVADALVRTRCAVPC